jgi:tetratricopeptide (TPR) repeat protein
MPLVCRLIRTLATCAVACFSFIVAAAAQSPAPWSLCQSHDLRLADQAIAACSDIIASSRSDSDAAATAYGYRGIALQRRAGNQQDREQALRDLEKAVGSGLDTAIAYVFRAQLHLIRQNPDLAIADCDEAIRRDPQIATAFAVRGGAFAAKQDFDRSAVEYGEALRLDPTYAIAFLSRARAYSARADWSRAVADLDQVLQLDSTSRTAAAAFTARAKARHEMSDFAGAIADCDAALKLNPLNEQALQSRMVALDTLVTRARAYIARADWSRAAADVDQVLRLDSTSRTAVEAFKARAKARQEMSDFAGAIADSDAALKLNPRDAYALQMRTFVLGALVTRARASIARAEWGRAAADLDQVLQQDSTSPGAAALFTTRATARYQMSDFAGAIADSDAALKLDPRNEQALRIRAFAHVGQGTASSTGGPSSMPDALMIYVARGSAGACGEKCEEWIAVEGTVDQEGPRRLIAALDRLGARKLPVVLNFRGRSGFTPAMSIGKLLRERGFEATVGQTLVDECDDPLQARCMALKRAGKPLQARLVPSPDCGVACVLGLAGGVRRTLPDATTVVIGGMFVPNRIGLAAVAPFREGRHVRFRDLIKVHLTQMGVDPKVADMMEEHYDSPRATQLSREDVVRLRIVTTQ